MQRPKHLGLASAVIMLSLVGTYAAFAVSAGGPSTKPKPHAPTTSSPNAPPLGLEGDWQPVLSEHFTGTALDTSRWSTCYFWDCTNRANPELEWFQASQVSVSNGVLSLTAMPEETQGKQYVSGMISSYGKFSYTYGYTQIVAKLPTGQGLWSAFWTLPETGGWPPEIDMMENWAQMDNVNMWIHFGQVDRVGTAVSVPTFSKAFHAYGVDWEPGSIKWYVDGVLEAHYAISITEPEYLIATLSVASNPAPDSKVRFPQSFQIRSIQVWQHPLIGGYTTAP